MGCGSARGLSRRCLVGVLVALGGLVLAAPARGQLGEQHVLLLVNGDSPVSVHVAKMYRQYHPGIANEQVLVLSGLSDCASPSATAADEIITRQEFESLIAQPTNWVPI